MLDALLMMYIDIPGKMNAGVSVGRDNNFYMFSVSKTNNFGNVTCIAPFHNHMNYNMSANITRVPLSLLNHCSCMYICIWHGVIKSDNLNTQ